MERTLKYYGKVDDLIYEHNGVAIATFNQQRDASRAHFNLQGRLYKGSKMVTSLIDQNEEFDQNDEFDPNEELQSHTGRFRSGKIQFKLGRYCQLSQQACTNFMQTYSHLICTFISENQGLEKLRSVSNLRKISGPAHLNFFQ